MIGAQALSLAALACFAGETIVLARGLGIDGPTWWQLAVLAALGALMQTDIHALKINAYTPAER